MQRRTWSFNNMCQIYFTHINSRKVCWEDFDFCIVKFWYREFSNIPSFYLIWSDAESSKLFLMPVCIEKWVWTNRRWDSLPWPDCMNQIVHRFLNGFPIFHNLLVIFRLIGFKREPDQLLEPLVDISPIPDSSVIIVLVHFSIEQDNMCWKWCNF